jgi:ribose transport system ATP-binding protein
VTETILKSKSITKKFPGVIALDNVDLDIKKGEVHALVGENGAGKSTLIKILTGAYIKDEGTIYWKDNEIEIKNPKHAIELGIAAIYQELNLIPELSVAENIFLGREIKEKGTKMFLDIKTMREKARQILKDLGQNIDPTMKTGFLGIGKQQMVEIAKALSMNAEIIIMDEPTSSLSGGEVRELMKTIHRLREKGISVIFISHRLEEVMEIADRATVLRDGQKIITVNISETTKEDLIKYMVGRSLEEQFPKIPCKTGEEGLRVENLNRGNILKDINFTAYKGEVLGVAGLVGSGRTEMARAIFGADPIDSGEIYIEGHRVKIKSPQDAIKHGMAFLTEDRKGQGLFLDDDINFNMTIASLKKFIKRLLLNIKEQKNETKKLIKDLQIKPPDINKKARNLSGGNQQKLVIGKWLSSDADVFIFDEPTRGIDVGAKVEVYNLINSLTKKGKTIIMISSELPEILGMSDRIIVMHEGRIAGEFERHEATQEKIMKAATGEVQNCECESERENRGRNL